MYLKGYKMINISKLDSYNHNKLIVASQLISNTVKSATSNDEIIVFAIKNKYFKEILESNLNVNKLPLDYRMMYIEDYNENDFRNIDRNIILIADNGIPFHIIENSSKKFLIIDLLCNNPYDIKNSLVSLIIQNVSKHEKFNLKDKISYSTFTKKLNPLEVINKDSQTIIEVLSLVLGNITSKTFIKKHTFSIFRGMSYEEILLWQQRINTDIDFLEKQKILTCRLARLIYKISYLNDSSSDKKIGSFFQKSLGIKSKNTFAPLWDISNLKCYHLYESTNNSTKRYW